jgi:hypothetical protein
MDDCPKCQTSTATPAEPGDLSWEVSKLTFREEARNIDAMGFEVRVDFIKLARIS